jgi:serine/threonine protein kinase
MRRAARSANDESQRETVGHLAGAVVGTPEYMAPEQLIGAAPSPVSDIYAAGVVLHECLTGTTPFDADTRLTFIARKLEPPVAPTRAVTLNSSTAGLDGVIARMMSASVDVRPDSALALFDELAQLD